MGRVFKFHNDVDTDQIIASQYLLLPNIEEMKVYTFESIDKDFAKKVKEGDIVVAGENFGCGSSREQAPSILKAQKHLKKQWKMFLNSLMEKKLKH